MDVIKEIEALVKKAAEAKTSEDAMKFSQAACNASNAMACCEGVRKSKEEK